MQQSTQPSRSMPCPACRIPLSMSERQGVEIDFCPQCRGVWLDRGELDKIIERTERAAPATIAGTALRPDNGEHSYGDQRRSGHHGNKRRKGFLAELFD